MYFIFGSVHFSNWRCGSRECFWRVNFQIRLFRRKVTFGNGYNGEIGLHMKSNFKTGFISLLTKNGKLNFLPPRSHFCEHFRVIGGELGGVFSSNVPRELLIKPCKFQDFPINYITSDVFCLLVKRFHNFSPISAMFIFYISSFCCYRFQFVITAGASRGGLHPSIQSRTPHFA